MSDIEKKTQFEIDDRIRTYLLQCGIPPKYAIKGVSMSSFGDVGKKFSDIMSDPHKIKEYFVDNGISVINFYGPSFVKTELVSLMIRSFLLLFLEASVIRLNPFNPVEFLDHESENYSELLSAKAIGIKNFYTSGYASGSESNRFHIQDFTERYLEGGGKLIISSESKISNWSWYTKDFKDLITLGADEYLIS